MQHGTPKVLALFVRTIDCFALPVAPLAWMVHEPATLAGLFWAAATHTARAKS